MRRGNAKPFTCVLEANPVLFYARRTAATRIEEPHAWTDKLLKVLVARDDDDVQARRSCLPRQRADHVVGLITTHRYDRHAIRLEELANPFHAAVEIRLKLLGELLACRLVTGVRLMTERQP